MANFESGILKSNVKMLLKNNDMTQEELGKVIGMSQSNMSKALNEKSKKCFTVAQIYDIAEHFHVSIDWLVGGRSTSGISSRRAIAENLASLLREGIVQTTPVEIKEYVYEPYWSQDGYPDCSRDWRHIKYTALYFSNYWSPSDFAKDEEEYSELDSEACQAGNESRNVALNTFLDKYLQILSVYKAGNLPEEAYQLVLKEYLNQIPET